MLVSVMSIFMNASIVLYTQKIQKKLYYKAWTTSLCRKKVVGCSYANAVKSSELRSFRQNNPIGLFVNTIPFLFYRCLHVVTHECVKHAVFSLSKS